MNRKLLKIELNATEQILKKAITALKYSIAKVKNINFSEDSSLDEMEILEAFSSRYSRLSDLYTQKYLKTFFLLLGESNFTLIDKSNYLQKIAIADSDILLEIRNLRNDFTHEYLEENLIEMYKKAIEFSLKLIELAERTMAYSSINIK